MFGDVEEVKSLLLDLVEITTTFARSGLSVGGNVLNGRSGRGIALKVRRDHVELRCVVRYVARTWWLRREEGRVGMRLVDEVRAFPRR